MEASAGDGNAQTGSPTVAAGEEIEANKDKIFYYSDFDNKDIDISIG